MSVQNFISAKAAHVALTGFEAYDQFLYFDSSDKYLGYALYTADPTCDLTAHESPEATAALFTAAGGVIMRPANTAATATVDSTKTQAFFAYKDFFEFVTGS